MKILITAGPTREAIDPVRYLSNRSSGKMGYAIAEAAREAGHTVTLVSGPVCLAAPDGVRIVRVTTADEMHDAVHAFADQMDLVVMAAAVADWKPAKISSKKLKKNTTDLHTLALIPTRDILLSLAKKERVYKIIGFAAETNLLRQHALEKLRSKNCDLLIANDVSRIDAGFESDHNALELFFADGSHREFPRAPKRELGAALVRVFESMLKKC